MHLVSEQISEAEESSYDEWLEEKAALGPVFLINAKGFSTPAAVAAMLSHGGWKPKWMESKLGKLTEVILERAAEGTYVSDLARALDVDRHGLKRFCDKLGIDIEFKPTLESFRQEILGMVEDGMSIPKIAGELGYSSVAVSKWLQKNGIALPSHHHSGYVVANGKYICVPVKSHPRADAKGYVRIHRLMVEKRIGRILKADEVVHHRDGNTFNNHPDNLQLMTATEHSSYHRRNGDSGRKKI